MTEARVTLLSQTRAVEVAEDVGVPAQLAELNIFRVLLHQPRTAKAVSDLLLSMLFGGALNDRLRELVIMRIGWVTGSDYEWTQHWSIAQETFGCSEADVLAVRDWAGHAGFGAAEQAVLAATDETLTDGAASASTITNCRELLGEDATIELVTAISTWSAISEIARSLAIPLEDGIDSWPPDGRPGGES